MPQLKQYRNSGREQLAAFVLTFLCRGICICLHNLGSVRLRTSVRPNLAADLLNFENTLVSGSLDE